MTYGVPGTAKSHIPFVMPGRPDMGRGEQTAGDFRNPEHEASRGCRIKFGSECVYQLEGPEGIGVPTQLHRYSHITMRPPLLVIRANTSPTSSSVAKRPWLAASRSALAIFRGDKCTSGLCRSRDANKTSATSHCRASGRALTRFKTLSNC